MPESLYRVLIAVVVTFVTLCFSGNGNLYGNEDSSSSESVLSSEESQRIAVIDRISKSVAAIFSPTGEGGGSGVVISPDGYCLTNYHVVQPCGTAAKVGLNDGKVYDAVVVGIDPVGDVALIKLLGREDFPCSPMGDSDMVHQGDWVLVLGNPFLLADDFTPSVSFGMVSGVHRYQFPADTLLEYADCIQTDASVNPGNSGGPMFNLNGEVVGINGRCSFDKRGRVNVGVGYAISINQIKKFLPQLKAGCLCDHATLGALIESDLQGKPVVTEILDNSDAYAQGLREEDEILWFDGRRIHTTNEFKNALGTLPKGWYAPISWRTAPKNRTLLDPLADESTTDTDDKTTEVVVRLAGVHGAAELAEKVNPDKPLPNLEELKKKIPENVPEEQKLKLEKQLEERLKQMVKKQETPEPIKDCYEKRPGFVNFHFNRLARQAVIDRWHNGLSQKNWSLKGKLEDKAGFTLEVTSKGLTLTLPEVVVRCADPSDLTRISDPADAGHLAPAMFAWYAVSTGDEAFYSALVYTGQFPIDTDGTLCDCLEGHFGGLKTEFLFSVKTGDLIRLNFFEPNAIFTPWVIDFDDYIAVPSPGKVAEKSTDKVADKTAETATESKPGQNPQSVDLRAPGTVRVTNSGQTYGEFRFEY